MCFLSHHVYNLLHTFGAGEVWHLCFTLLQCLVLSTRWRVCVGRWWTLHAACDRCETGLHRHLPFPVFLTLHQESLWALWLTSVFWLWRCFAVLQTHQIFWINNWAIRVRWPPQTAVYINRCPEQLYWLSRFHDGLLHSVKSTHQLISDSEFQRFL